jgi:thymidine kinase
VVNPLAFLSSITQQEKQYLLMSVYGTDRKVIGCYQSMGEAEALMTKIEQFKENAANLIGHIIFVDDKFDTSTIEYFHKEVKSDYTVIFILDKLSARHTSKKTSFFSYLVNETKELDNVFIDEHSYFSIEEVRSIYI